MQVMPSANGSFLILLPAAQKDGNERESWNVLVSGVTQEVYHKAGIYFSIE